MCSTVMVQRACVQPGSPEWLLYEGIMHPCSNLEGEMWWMVRHLSAAAQLHKGTGFNYKQQEMQMQVCITMMRVLAGLPSCNLVSQFCHCLKSSCHSCGGVSTGSCEKIAARAQISWLNAGLTPCQLYHIFLNACMNNRLAALCTLLAAIVTVDDCFLNHQA